MSWPQEGQRIPLRLPSKLARLRSGQSDCVSVAWGCQCCGVPRSCGERALWQGVLQLCGEFRFVVPSMVVIYNSRTKLDSSATGQRESRPKTQMGAQSIGGPASNGNRPGRSAARVQVKGCLTSDRRMGYWHPTGQSTDGVSPPHSRRYWQSALAARDRGSFIYRWATGRCTSDQLCRQNEGGL